MKVRGFARHAAVAGSVGLLLVGLAAATPADATRIAATVTGTSRPSTVVGSQIPGGPVYVGTSNSNSVYVVDSVSHTVTSTIYPAGGQVQGLAAGSVADDRIYVGMNNPIGVTALHAGVEDDSWVAPGGYPGYVSGQYLDVATTAGHDDTVYAGVYVAAYPAARGYVVALDASTLTADDSFPLSVAPSGLVVARDDSVAGDDSILVTSRTGSQLLIVNPRNFDDSVSVAVPLANGVAVSTDDSWAYVVSSGASAGAASFLYRIDFRTATVDDSIDLGIGFARGVAEDAQGMLYITGDGEVAVVDSGTFSVVDSVSGTQSSAYWQSIGLVAMSSNDQPYVTNYSDNTVSVLGPGSPTPPTPDPVYPPSAPLAVNAVAGEASATVSWSAPASTGSYPVTDYQVTSSPGGKTCMTKSPALSCEVSGLTGEVSYTFTVEALNGAGWSAASHPSNAVTPTSPPAKTIVIVGSRDARDPRQISVTGSTTGLVGRTVTPYVKHAGDVGYTEGAARPTVAADGSFDWGRKTGKKVHIYFTAGSVRSNILTVAAR